MKFNTKDLNPGVFFPFDEDNPSEGITLRLVNNEIITKVNKKTVKKKLEFRRGRQFERIDEDEKLREEMIWDYIIVDWKGVEDEDGSVLECNRENKCRLMRGSVWLAGFVADCTEILSDQAGKAQEDAEKN